MLNHSESHHGRFFESTSILPVLSKGPGAVIKLLLRAVPDLAGDDRFSLLTQIVAAVGDTEYVRLLIERGAYV